MACSGVEPAADPSLCQKEIPIDECLEACPVGCPAPEYWPCGENGQKYCNECVMACYQVSLAEDPATCEDTSLEDCLFACPIGCPSPEYWPCASDGQKYCNECIMGCYGVEPASDPAICEQSINPEECIANCGIGCPAPEYWLCASDGELYCNECIMACYAVTLVEDKSFCEKEVPVEECLTACGIVCPAPEYWLCGVDGQLYCNECIMACYEVEKAADPSSCEQSVQYCISNDDCQDNQICRNNVCQESP